MSANRTAKQNVVGGLFNVVNFPNLPCSADNGYNGTCMTLSECTSTGGVQSGSCARGYGACCYYSTTECGASVYYNQTYLKNTAWPSTVSGTLDCEYKIYRINDNICNARFDFIEFEMGPPLHTDSTFSCQEGSTDIVTFTNAANMYNDMYLCGYNNGQHVYIDMGTPTSSPSYGTMKIHLDKSNWSSYNRKWNIMVSQIECGEAYTPPKGCGQFFYGNGGQGTILAYNYDQPNQEYWAKLKGSHTICIRREEGMCQIGYVPPSIKDDAYGLTITGGAPVVWGRKSCGKPQPGGGTCTDDWIKIPNASNTGNTPFANCDRYCGHRFCDAHNGCNSVDHMVQYSRQIPFEVKVEFSDHSTSNVLKGYKLNYWQSNCN